MTFLQKTPGGRGWHRFPISVQRQSPRSTPAKILFAMTERRRPTLRQTPLPLGHSRTQPLLPRRRMGRPRPRRPHLVRVHHVGRRASRTELGNHPEKARSLPQSLLEFRSEKSRSLRRQEKEIAARRCRHHPQSPENRFHDHQRASLPAKSKKNSAASTITSGDSSMANRCNQISTPPAK